MTLPPCLPSQQSGICWGNHITAWEVRKKMADRKKTSLKETIAFVFRKMPGFRFKHWMKTTLVFLFTWLISQWTMANVKCRNARLSQVESKWTTGHGDQWSHHLPVRTNQYAFFANACGQGSKRSDCYTHIPTFKKLNIVEWKTVKGPHSLMLVLTIYIW
jgi:hypothetical protein